MRTFNSGDKVTCTIRGNKITNAKIFIPHGGMNKETERYAYICHNDPRGIGDNSNEKLGYKYSFLIHTVVPGKDYRMSYFEDLTKNNIENNEYDLPI